jgi:hypothetical protein
MNFNLPAAVGIPENNNALFGQGQRFLVYIMFPVVVSRCLYYRFTCLSLSGPQQARP